MPSRGAALLARAVNTRLAVAALVSAVAVAVSAASPAVAQAPVGPGLGNLTYGPGELFTPIAVIRSPHGHGNVTMVQGYLMVIYSSDGGGDGNSGGIEFWDVSNPRLPVLARRYEDADTHGLREAHGFSLARNGDRLLLAAQGLTGIQVWDVTEPMAIRLVTSFPLPGIARGDYSGDWWVFWQAPYLYVAGVDQGLYVVDLRDPAAPVLLAQVPTGELGGVSPAQVFVLGNLAVVMESQGSAMATLDVSTPERPRLLQQVSGRPGYSHLFAGDGKILVSGSIPPRAHFLQVSPTGDITYLWGCSSTRAATAAIRTASSTRASRTATPSSRSTRRCSSAAAARASVIATRTSGPCWATW
jgi:hypothetical protein